MGIQVADLEGARISFRDAFVRSFMKLLSSCLLFIPHLLALFTERKQALHDLVAETVVLEGREDVPVVDAWIDMAKQVLLSRAKAGERGRLGDLERLQSLYESGVLTKEEFDIRKQKILEASY